MADSIFKSVSHKDFSKEGLTQRFSNTLRNLNEVLATSGTKKGAPIYSVWIKFQIGQNDDTAIFFDTTSTVYERNLIANLQITKGQNGYANDFTLNIVYDAFHYGQETDVGGVVEQLDQWVAEAIAYDFETDDNAKLAGKLQYGYNSFDDQDRQLYTPIYNFLLTDAKSTTDFTNGITNYSFSGVAYIGTDINFVTSIDTQKGRPLTIVKRILTKYYGKPGDEYDGYIADETALGYTIDISEEDLNEQQKDEIEYPGANMNPWKYCEQILNQFFRTQYEIDSQEYTEEKLATMQAGQKPRYVMYISEAEDEKIIHIEHVSSLNINDKDILDYEFTWMNNQNNIVTKWTPQVDLSLYLIRYASVRRDKLKFNKLKKAFLDADFQNNATAKARGDLLKEMDALQTSIVDVNNTIVQEYYDAELQCIGIPTDIPIGLLIKVKPVIFQTVSRTAGIYFITGASDSISTNGVYTTTLKLFRVNSIEKFVDYNNEIISYEDYIINNHTIDPFGNASYMTEDEYNGNYWDAYEGEDV